MLQGICAATWAPYAADGVALAVDHGLCFEGAVRLLILAALFFFLLWLLREIQNAQLRHGDRSFQKMPARGGLVILC